MSEQSWLSQPPCQRVKLYFTRDDGELIEFTYTFPKEEWHHSTRKLHKSDIKIVTKKDRTEAALIRQEILDDIQPPKEKATGKRKVRDS